jgi:hypothetical protein
MRLTYTGARMICAVAREGKRVGITANSHRVIRNLLDEVVLTAREQHISIGCIQKISDKEDDRPGLRFTTDNAVFLDALHSDCRVGGGTAWFWARPDAARSVDVLFIDEAAQMSLANVLAVSQAAQSIVLLGDPRQLEQPIPTVSTYLRSTISSDLTLPCPPTEDSKRNSSARSLPLGL